LPIPKI